MTQPKIEGVGHGVPRMLYASDGSNWYAILVDLDGHVKIDVVTSALPTDAATQTTLALIKTAVEKIDDLQGALGSVATDILRVASKSGDKIFGFESIVEEALSNTALTAGANILSGTPVPSGKVWKITQACINYVGTITNVTVLLSAIGLATGLRLIDQKTIVSNQWYFWSGEIYLQAEDYISFTIAGATLNDDAYLRYAGVQMNAP